MWKYIYNQVRTRPGIGRIALRSIPNIKWRVDVTPIGKMVVRLRQNRMYWLRAPLTHEGFMLGSLQRLIRKGDTVYDIGANIGLYSRFIAQHFHASRVYAFEPMETNRAMLAENLKIGNCADKVTILSCAISDRDGTCDFQVDDVTTGSGTLDSVTHGEASGSRRQYGLPPLVVQVTTSRLDTLLSTQNLVKPDVIKIDIEGAEVLALEGARQTLLTHSPRLVIEIHGPEIARNVLPILWSLGYHCYGRLYPEGRYPYATDRSGTDVHKKLTPEDLTHINWKYALPNLVASMKEDEISQPIEDFCS